MIQLGSPGGRTRRVSVSGARIHFKTLATSEMRWLCRSCVDVGPDSNPARARPGGASYPAGTELHTAATHPLFHSLSLSPLSNGAD